MSVVGPSFRLPGIIWGAASQAIAGEAISGDAYLVTRTANGVLLAVVDGLGHGKEAASAAASAVDALSADPNRGAERLIECCHHALEGTRWAVMSLALIDTAASSMTWLGVGNVTAALVRVDPSEGGVVDLLTVRGGVVGSHLPLLRSSQRELRPDDLLLFATDGISERFADNPPRAGDPYRLAAWILAEYRGSTDDDALVLAARFLGPPP